MTSILMQMDWFLISTVHLAASVQKPTMFAIMSNISEICTRWFFNVQLRWKAAIEWMNNSKHYYPVIWKVCSSKKIPIKRFPWIYYNFRTFLFIFPQNLWPENFRNFSCGNFPENRCYFSRNFPTHNPREMLTNQANLVSQRIPASGAWHTKTGVGTAWHRIA